MDDRLIQLTWKEQKALVYNRADFKPAGEFRYDGEGWGLCWDGKRLVMSDGSDRLTFRDPKTFAVLGTLNVTVAGKPVYELNELECVDGVVYANVWQTDEILRIDPRDGRVTAVIDAVGPAHPRGAAADRRAERHRLGPGRSKTFLITGKLWPKMFEVTFVPAVPRPLMRRRLLSRSPDRPGGRLRGRKLRAARRFHTSASPLPSAPLP